jgi:V/A-type H+-transporting ATPase subunit E
MPLDDILKGIRDKAQATSDEILKAAEETASERVRGAQERGQALAKGILAQAESKASAQELVAKSRAESQARQMILKQKQDLMSSVFDRALASLQATPVAEYEEMLLKAIVETAGGGEEVVLGHEDEERLGAGFASLANEALEKSGRPGIAGVSFSTGSLGGGLLLRKGGVVTNITFPAALKKIRDELEIDVAALLFQEQ